MRITLHEQPRLMTGYANHVHGRELARMDEILSSRPWLLEPVREDLERGCSQPGTGRLGMTAEQVLRALVVKQMRGFPYEELAFQLADSQSYRTFCRIGHLTTPPSKSALQSNIKRLSAATLEQVNLELLGTAREEGVESGRQIRADATVVATNIHAPTDSSLLYDAVRVLSRLMKRAQTRFGVPGQWHTRRAKRRALDVLNAKDSDARIAAYRDLLLITRCTMRAAKAAAARLRVVETPEPLGAAVAQAMADELDHYEDLTQTLVYQTQERVLKGKTVAADEKLFSIFESHTDIVIKDRRQVQYGHKVTLTQGKSTLILDCVIEEGNPADSTLAKRTIERQDDIYGRPPRQAAFDGGYASRANVSAIKEMGVADVAMHKKRGLSMGEMARSSWIYKKLKNFRAGIEAGISFLKRCFGLDRCTWRGYRSFEAYVWASVVSANLLILARHGLSEPATD